MAMTMAEKILARASEARSLAAGEYVTATADRIMAHEAFGACARTLLQLGITRLFDPDRVVVILDHYFPAPTPAAAGIHRVVRQLAERFGIRHFLSHAGICHQVLSEWGYILPGHLVLGTDSHSTTYGAFGAGGTGIGLTEMSYVLATGELWMQVPPTIRFELVGEQSVGLMSKDIVLHIAGAFGTEVAQYRAIEFAGPVADRMSIASRMTMSNMGVELGAKFAFFVADEQTLAYLRERTDERLALFGPDPDATYAGVHEVDVNDLEPQVACPHNPGDVKPVSQVGDVGVDQAFLGSCTNGRLEDLAVAAQILKGRKVHPGTRFLITPASQQVYLEATAAGYIEVLLEAGAHITPAACGACPGAHMGVLGTGEVCISSTNRNFRGRMGSPEADIYLGSPATVAAAAVAGRIVDPREFWTETTLS
ncbi:MAG: 3-isopropylmalate dehydratase large subunit [Dehalococcoidia bacterium]|nr:MAG: 3-isopropylmalate dehydratase large subunit [Dehalococcoidia bacterium]